MVHEYAIAEGVLGIVARHAAGRKVARVDLKVGCLRQVVPDALEFAFELAARGTRAEGAELVIEEVPASVQCRECGMVSSAPTFPMRCASCGTFKVDVASGEELLVQSLEVEEDPCTAPR
jgi:hydrogenase nickel incorporation protein HypA/HybF